MQREYEPLIQELLRLLREEFGDRVRAKLDQLRARMKTLGSRKIVLDDGTYYWLLKPGLRFGEVIEL